MAFSAVTARGSSVATASATSIGLSPSANITVGKLCFAFTVTDNFVTSDGASSQHTIADSVGNTWRKISEYTETDGVAADGVTISTWGCLVQTQIGTGNTVTATFANSVACRIISLVEVTVGAGKHFAIEQVGVGQAAIAATVTGMANREYLLLGHGGAEGTDNTKTPDADYTEQFDLRTSNSGNQTTQHVVTRIATLTSDTCTSSAWTNTNPMFLLAALYEVDVTQSTTVSAKARILTAGVSTTVSSKARILTAGVTKTVSAKANIELPTTEYQQTVQAKARILTTQSATITAKARVFTPDITKTAQAKARLLQTVSATISAGGRILKVEQQTVQAQSRILNTISQTVQARARILRTELQTVGAKARLLVTSSATATAKARIIATLQTTVSAKARLQKTQVITASSQARILIENTKTVSAKALIAVAGAETYTNTVSAKACILQTNTKTISNKARIKATNSQTVAAQAKIWDGVNYYLNNNNAWNSNNQTEFASQNQATEVLDNNTIFFTYIATLYYTENDNDWFTNTVESWYD